MLGGKGVEGAADAIPVGYMDPLNPMDPMDPMDPIGPMDPMDRRRCHPSGLHAEAISQVMARARVRGSSPL